MATRLARDRVVVLIEGRLRIRGRDGLDWYQSSSKFSKFLSGLLNPTLLRYSQGSCDELKTRLDLNREVVHKPFEPLNGFFCVRTFMANGSNGFDNWIKILRLSCVESQKNAKDQQTLSIRTSSRAEKHSLARIHQLLVMNVRMQKKPFNGSNGLLLMRANFAHCPLVARGTAQPTEKNRQIEDGRNVFRKKAKLRVGDPAFSQWYPDSQGGAWEKAIPIQAVITDCLFAMGPVG
ncbi:hypothetical protein B0H11DRAFT_1904380 [Mycena galericulata]|nr:hypothetical protein B0H11DRAFT_1904380 [Mycena galericulata]